MPPLEAWEKVFIGSDTFLKDVHNTPNCIGCHGGQPGTDDKVAAHKGVVRDPSADKGGVCANCHGEIAKTSATSLHYTINGYYTILGQRGFDFNDPKKAEIFDRHCTSCHATCGQCHISRPTSADGGLVKEHQVKSIVSLSDTCLGCHGGRVGPEFMGKNPGVPGDVHWTKGINCFKCHNMTQFHGDGTLYAHRYDGKPAPSCLDCHPDAAPGKGQVMQHNIHGDKLDCRVCHSAGAYKSCWNCHVGLDKEGLPYRKLDPSVLTFKIGKNPNPTPDRPWEYVLVRHIPVPADIFGYYGDNMLPNWASVPTWKYATVHNIQKITPQNKDCKNCHGHPELFLTEKDVDPAELEANRAVIVTEIPK